MNYDRCFRCNHLAGSPVPHAKCCPEHPMQRRIVAGQIFRHFADAPHLTRHGNCKAPEVVRRQEVLA